MNCQDVQEPLSQVPIFCVPSVFRWIEIAVMYKCKLARPKITRSDVVTSHNFQNSMNILQFQYFHLESLSCNLSPSHRHPCLPWYGFVVQARFGGAVFRVVLHLFGVESAVGAGWDGWEFTSWRLVVNIPLVTRVFNRTSQVVKPQDFWSIESQYVDRSVSSCWMVFLEGTTSKCSSVKHVNIPFTSETAETFTSSQKCHQLPCPCQTERCYHKYLASTELILNTYILTM